MARLLADEDFPMPAVRELRDQGHDVWCVVESDRAGTRWPDEEIFAEAQRQRRALMTRNRRHFLALHRQHPRHHGLILCTDNPDPADMARRIHLALQAAPAMADQCLRIYRPVS